MKKIRHLLLKCVIILVLLYPVAVFAEYIDNLDGTITDSNSGLMWQKCSCGQTWDGAQCTPIWPWLFIWYDAAPFVQEMSLAGYDDWQMPTINELEDLMDDRYTPMIDSVFSTIPKSFVWAVYWSGTTGDEFNASYLNYSLGFTGIAKQHSVVFVRAVRPTSGELLVSVTSDNYLRGFVSRGWRYNAGDSVTVIATPNAGYGLANWTEGGEVVSNDAEYTFIVDRDRDLVANFEVTTTDYIDNNNGIVSDPELGLEWQKCSYGQTWDGSCCTGDPVKIKCSEAMDYAEALVFPENGYDDWRVPSPYELETLFDERYWPVIDPIFADDTAWSEDSWYWSSSYYGIQSFAGSGKTSVADKSDRDLHYVRFVRGEQYPPVEPPIDKGHCLWFDGVDDYVDLGSSSDLKPTSAITVELWARCHYWDLEMDWDLISNQEGGGYAIETKSDGNIIQFQAYINGEYRTVKYEVKVFSGWHHFAGTFDGRYVKLYVDGELKDTNDVGSIQTISYDPDNCTLLGAKASGGCSPDGCQYMGKIDELRIWPVARTAAEINFYKNYRIDSEGTNMAACYHFDEESGNILPESVLSINGTLHNMSDEWVNSDVAWEEAPDMEPMDGGPGPVGAPVDTGEDEAAKDDDNDDGTCFISVITGK